MWPGFNFTFPTLCQMSSPGQGKLTLRLQLTLSIRARGVLARVIIVSQELSQGELAALFLAFRLNVK